MEKSIIYRIYKNIRHRIIIFIAFLYGAVALVDKFEVIKKSYPWIYLYTIIDIFKWELLLAIILLIYMNYLIRLVKGCIDYLKSLLKQRKLKELIYSSICFLAILASLLFMIYQVRYYFIGKKIYMSNYSGILISKSNKAFLHGNIDIAKSYLQVGVHLLGDSACQEVEKRIDSRIRFATDLKLLVSKMDIWNPNKAFLCEDIFLIDRNRYYYLNIIKNYQKEVAELTNEYSSILSMIKEKKYQEAAKQLDVFNEKHPGMGDCHIIKEEINLICKMNSNKIEINDEFPYVKEIMANNESDFIKIVFQVRIPRPPKKIDIWYKDYKDEIEISN